MTIGRLITLVVLLALGAAGATLGYSRWQGNGGGGWNAHAEALPPANAPPVGDGDDMLRAYREFGMALDSFARSPSPEAAPDAPWDDAPPPAPVIAPAGTQEMVVRERSEHDLTPERVIAEARVVTYPGAEVQLVSEIPGRVVRMLAGEKTRVRRGALLVELDASEQRAAIAEAQARVREAESDVRLYTADLERAERLGAVDHVARATVDRARRDRDAAQARRDVAQAAVTRLTAVAARARVYAPIDGVVIAQYAQVGERALAGTPLLRIADLSRTRIEAEVNEFDSRRVVVGAPVLITAEGYDGKAWRGVVEEVPDALVARRLRPQDPGRPTDTRVLLVKIRGVERLPFRLNQRVDAAIAAR